MKGTKGKIIKIIIFSSDLIFLEHNNFEGSEKIVHACMHGIRTDIKLDSSGKGDFGMDKDTA